MNQKDMKKLIKEALEENVELQELVQELLGEIYQKDSVDYVSAKNHFELIASNYEEFGCYSFNMIKKVVEESRKNREKWNK